MAETHAPGWKATVNGQDVEIMRANYALRAVPIPAGKTRVELDYRPPGFMFGALISLLTIGGMVTLGVMTYRSRRRREDPVKERPEPSPAS